MGVLEGGDLRPGYLGPLQYETWASHRWLWGCTCSSCTRRAGSARCRTRSRAPTAGTTTWRAPSPRPRRRPQSKRRSTPLFSPDRSHECRRSERAARVVCRYDGKAVQCDAPAFFILAARTRSARSSSFSSHSRRTVQPLGLAHSPRARV